MYSHVLWYITPKNLEWVGMYCHVLWYITPKNLEYVGMYYHVLSCIVIYYAIKLE
jgi:hypothetical protein